MLSGDEASTSVCVCPPSLQSPLLSLVSVYKSPSRQPSITFVVLRRCHVMHTTRHLDAIISRSE